jgi:hypothetical protein
MATCSLGDEDHRLVVDHLPLVEQALEVPLEVGLGVDLAREGGGGAPAASERTRTWSAMEIEPELHAAALVSCHWR